MAALAAPQLSVSEAVWDFGIVESGSANTHTFVLRNTGDEPLIISAVTTSCDCTTAPLTTPYTLNPGEKIDLAVTLHVPAVGTVTRTVNVSSNDPASPLRMIVKATVPEKTSSAVAPADLAKDYSLLLDLRTQAEYAGGHILGAMSSPYADLASWAGTLPQDALIVVYDLDGTLAPTAVAALRAAGIPQVFSLDGGYAAWAATYLTLTTTSGPASESFLAPSAAARTSAPELLSIDVRDLYSIFTVLVDLRSEADFAAAHLAGAVNSSAGDLTSLAVSLPKDITIVLYGEAGEGVAPAKTLAETLGMRETVALDGGLAAWRATLGDVLLVRTE